MAGLSQIYADGFARDLIPRSTAPTFLSSTSYAVGDYVYYQGSLYRCTTAHTGTWVASHFTAVTIGSELKAKEASLQSEIDDVKSDLSDLDDEIYEEASIETRVGSTIGDSLIAPTYNSAFSGYALMVKPLQGISKVVGKFYPSNGALNVDFQIHCSIYDSTFTELATDEITFTYQNRVEDFTFTFNNVNIPTTYGYIGVYVSGGANLKLSYIDARQLTFNTNVMYGYDSSHVSKYLASVGGSWANLTLSQSSQFTLSFDVYTKQTGKVSKISELETDVTSVTNKVNSLPFKGTWLYVTTAEELADALEEAESATADNWYNIYVKGGEYDILPYVDLSRITTVTATGYRGVEVPRYTRVIGEKGNRPHIYAYLDDTSITTEQRWTVSPLNMRNDAELYNLFVDVRNGRYAVHDDGGTVAYKRYCENCLFLHQGFTVGSFANQFAYGNGLRGGCVERFKDCVFIAPYYGLYIHDNPNYTSNMKIEIEQCRFETVSKNNAVEFESMGASASTKITIVDSSFNAPIYKKIDSETDNMTISGYNNEISTALGITINTSE